MAETELRAGVTIELLTQSELAEELQSLRKFLRDLDPPAPTIIKATTELTSDASGNIGGGSSGPGALVYQVPVGFEAFIHRVRVTAVGYSPASPLQNGELSFARNGPTLSTVEFFLPVSGTVAPVVITDGSNSAPQLASGETLVAFGRITANTTLFVGLQLRLWKSKSAIIGAG